MSSSLKFGYSILYVADVPKTVDFYGKAFGLSCRFIAPGDSYAEMETGSTTLAFAQHELAAENLPQGYQAADRSNQPFGIEIAFTTPKIDLALSTAINAGAEVLSPVREKPWGQKVAYLRDLNGFVIELCTPMS